ncbi:hypothetical protein FRC11_009907 [Ceratobasidium sp. 423]|nr:hypothetical protein FRC11_009907 [Ceratobasidium sp. 423]
MSFFLSSIPINSLLAWSLGNGGRGYVRVVFPFNLDWYKEQPSTKFNSFQHRKEQGGFRHEFIVLKMADGSLCRVERTGDPDARTRALTLQGSAAYDLIQSYRPDEIAKAHLDTSTIVADVHLPGELDLKDEFLTEIQQQFRGTISKLSWENVANGVFWYHELEVVLDGVIQEELRTAWWRAAALFLDPEGKAISYSRSSPSSDSELGPLVFKCLSALWNIIQNSDAGEKLNHIRQASRRMQSNMHNAPRVHATGHAQASVNQSDPTGLMDCRGTMSDEFERVKALTATQWLMILWLHAKQTAVQIFGLFIALSTALVWVRAFGQRTYVDIELARTVSDLEHPDRTETERLVGLLKKLHALCSINSRNAIWTEYPWARVLSKIKKRLPSDLLLEKEPVLISVSVEGGDISDITIAAFQQHILHRVELQAKLVERVWLGSAVKVSAEIQHKLSLVWAMFRNDPFDDPFDGRIGSIEGMTMDEVLHELYHHGCRNATPYFIQSMTGDFPAVTGGGFGDIYRGVLNNGAEVGLKCIRLEVGLDDGERKNIEDAAHELYIWSKCKHPNVLELIGVTRHRNQIAMVSPWMENGDLTRFLHTHPEVDRYSLCAQIADGVAYLHQEKVVHSDLRAANILVSRDHMPKIVDFGDAHLLGYTETDRMNRMTIRWTAPELISEVLDKTTAETDVFSLGMTILV